MRFYYRLIIYIFFISSFHSIMFAQKSAHTTMGIASYYHGWLDGKKTANGEIYNKSLMTAAHPSLPFNSKVKVTNLYNQKSIVVRINDRGPFVNKRIIDLSRAAADSLDFIYSGLAKVQLTVLSYGKINDAIHPQLLASLKTEKKPKTETIRETSLTKDTTKIETSLTKKDVIVFKNNKSQEITAPDLKIYKAIVKGNIITTSKITDSSTLADITYYGLQIASFKIKNNAEKLLEKMKLSIKEEINIQEVKKGNTGFFRLIIGKFANEKEVFQLKEKLKKEYPESFMIRY
ncbi:MAG: septal ring lytic transglycosylase RlpA family protein [Bacteroidetes bacterium]|nr:septal ring lytic transglycosylase RlpA family protein [Bacteroidota bacterium]